MSNHIKKKEQTRNSFQENAALIMGIFTLVVLCIFPVVYHHYYFDILETKYQFYCAVSLIAMAAMAGYGLAGGRIAAFFKDFNFKSVC